MFVAPSRIQRLVCCGISAYQRFAGEPNQQADVIIISYQVNMEIKSFMTTNVEHDLANYQSQLWQMADTLRGSMDASEYKHVVLGLIFLKYISDAFEERHTQLEIEREVGADPEDPDEYRAVNIFWVPPEARWINLQNSARQSTIGRTL